MEATLYLEAQPGMVGSVTDFTYKWCVNMGMSTDEASRMALAVDELLTNVILFGYAGSVGYVEVWFQYSMDQVEIIVQETGEPFDPERHRYSKQKALEEGNFEGAGFEIIKKMTDHFLFLNRGKDGKEFRLVKQLDTVSKAGAAPKEEPGEDRAAGGEDFYLLTPATGEDAEEIAKLIYRSYDYSYNKEDLYYPKRIETALNQGYKFGVVVRTSHGGPVGYFAVIKSTDSFVGEVGEAVVSPPHRRKGLMKRMLNRLIDMSRQQGLLGLFGLALTVHPFSQKVNEKYGFKNTALLLTKSPGSVYKELVEDYPQPVSVVVDFLPLKRDWTSVVYLPRRYESLIRKIYSGFGHDSHYKQLPDPVEKGSGKTDLDLKINYESRSALVIVRTFGDSFESSCLSLFKSLKELELNTIYIDLPLSHPWIEPAVEWLKENRFIIAGLMPLFHRERDFLRMQRVDVELDFELFATHSVMACLLKESVEKEYHAVQKNR